MPRSQILLALGVLFSGFLGSVPVAALMGAAGIMPAGLERLRLARSRRQVRRGSLRFLHAVLDAAELGGHPLGILELASHSCPVPARPSLWETLRSARQTGTLPVQLGEWANRWGDPTLVRLSVLVHNAMAQGAPLQRGVAHLVEMEEARRQARAELETALRALEWLTYGFLALEAAGAAASLGSGNGSILHLGATVAGRVVVAFVAVTSLSAAVMPAAVRWSAP